MKNTLLITAALFAFAGACMAHQTDPYTIIYDENELYSASNTSGWDPNGTVPPQPEADYYLDLTQYNNVYYRFEQVADVSPAEYKTNVSLLEGNFLIYAKGYWTERGKDGYNQNDYIYSSGDGSGGVTKDQLKQLANTGNPMTIEGGGTLYGAEFTFWPNGTNEVTYPALMFTGGSTVNQNISISGTASLSDSGAADISFTIATGGVVSPTTQTYTVTASYLPEDGETEVTKTIQVIGLTGEFTGLTGINLMNNTDFTLTVEIKNAPVFSDVSDQTTISGYKDLSATTTVTLAGAGSIYLIGNINNMAWNPSKGLTGELVSTLDPKFPNNSEVIVFKNVEFTGDKRFRFTTALGANWGELESKATQYYPAVDNTACANVWDNTTSNWYASQQSNVANNAWVPASDSKLRGADGNEVYDVFFNLKNHEVAVGWNLPTDVKDIDTAFPDAPVAVYTLLGTVVNSSVSAANATNGLPAGVYIVGGKKVLVP